MSNHALKNIADFSNSELRAFLDSFDNVLCDCDGVLWKLRTPIAKVSEAISKLKKIGKQVGAVTNNCLYKIEDLHKQFEKRTFDIDIDDIINPSVAIIHYLKENRFEKEIYLIGCSALKNELIRAGFRVTDSGEPFVEETLDGIQKHLIDNENIGAVVFDYDVNFTYIKIAKAVVYLDRPDVLFIIGASDIGARFQDYPPLMGPHGVQYGVQLLSGRNHIALGKPGKEFGEIVNAKFNIKKPSRTLFVGDSLTHDIKFANLHGYQSLLVLSGQSTLEEALECSGDTVADFYLNSLGELYDLISQRLNL